MLKILLDVVGIQRVGMEQDKMELTTIAELEENDTFYIIKYTEEQEPPIPAVNVCVKVNKDESLVEMTRSGPFESCLTIERSGRNLCRYGTEYGDILMGISGHSIETQFDGESGEFSFAYDIDINGALASKNEVRLIFRKNQE